MLLLSIFGCGMGVFSTPDGPDLVRGALYFAPDATLTLATNDTRKITLIVANSTFPCEPEVGEDDPNTPSVDEEGAALEYWRAQVATAFAREGARIAAFSLAVSPEEDWLGTYPLSSDAWDSDTMAGHAAEDGRAAAGGWYHVIEASVEDANGVLYATDGGIEVVEEEHDLTVGAPATLDVEQKDSVLAGSFDFPDDDLGGTFEAARCENLDLLTELTAILTPLLLAEVVDEGDTFVAIE